jgi:hypothetical protein
MSQEVGPHSISRRAQAQRISDSSSHVVELVDRRTCRGHQVQEGDRADILRVDLIQEMSKLIQRLSRTMQDIRDIDYGILVRPGHHDQSLTNQIFSQVGVSTVLSNLIGSIDADPWPTSHRFRLTCSSTQMI